MSKFLKVPFKDASSIVLRRGAFLLKGMAYVHIKDLNSIAGAQFRTKVAQELVLAYRNV